MEETSIKQMFQGMIPKQAELLQGTVTSASPLKIQAMNDAKLILGSASLVVPKHLTDHTVTISIPSSGGHSQESGTGVHSHTKVSMTVYNALKAGDKVHLLAVQNSKKYFILDRV